MPTYTHSAGVKCGNCSSRLKRPIYHVSILDVRACYGLAPDIPMGRQLYQNTRAAIPAPAATPRPPAIDDQLTKCLLLTKDGRYAVKMGPEDPFRFIRLSRPKNGKAKGFLKIQTQHSDTLMAAALIRLDGGRRYVQQPDLLPYLRMLVCDTTTAAMDYGRAMRRCSRCGIVLTDDRSRWFSIGPECEKYWPEIIAMVLDKRGPYVPGWES